MFKKKCKLLSFLLFILIFSMIIVSTVSAEDSANNVVNVKNYTELNTAISNGNSANLTQNITPASGESFGDGISVNNNVTVNGNGYCIDAKQTGRIFQITNPNVVLTLINVTLMNGKQTKGGAIYSDNDVHINATNVTFKNNTATWMVELYMHIIIF